MRAGRASFSCHINTYRRTRVVVVTGVLLYTVIMTNALIQLRVSAWLCISHSLTDKQTNEGIIRKKE